MASLLIHIGAGGVVGAGGALVGALFLLGLRMFFTRSARAQHLETIRQVGLIGAARHALFDVPEPD